MRWWKLIKNRKRFAVAILYSDVHILSILTTNAKHILKGSAKRSKMKVFLVAPNFASISLFYSERAFKAVFKTQKNYIQFYFNGNKWFKNNIIN